MRRFVLAFAVIAPICTGLLIGSHLLFALAILFTSHLLLLYPTLLPQSQWWGPVITRFATREAEVWLTIDDGPSAVHTRRILDLLEQSGALATFFLIGERAAAAPDLVEEIRRRGHSVANHSFTHPSANFWCASPGRIAQEIDRCNALLGSCSLFRAPAGLKNCFVHPALARRGLQLIGWTVRAFDTVSRDSDRVAAQIARRARPGAILLLHEGHRIETDPEFHLRCMEGTLRALTERGYRCVIPRPEQLRAGGR